MAELDISVAPRIHRGRFAIFWLQALLGLCIGIAGGVLYSVVLAMSLMHGIVYGGLFGLTFGLFFSRRTTSPGAGFIWGVAAALLLWIVVPAGILPLLHARHWNAMLSDARASFPELVAFLVCLGMPVGVTLGTWGVFHSRTRLPKFSWGRAIVAGGLAGMLAGFVFGQWVSPGNYFPLLAGYGELDSRIATVVLHFAVALLMGATFWCPLPERHPWLRLVDGMGFGLQHVLVVSWSSYALPCRGAPATGLVCRTRQQHVWFADRSHPVWTDARCHLRCFRSAVGTIVYSL